MARRKHRRRQTQRSSPGRSGPPAEQPWRALSAATQVERIAYSRKQAAEALGLSVATIDRRVVPLLHTVKTPWGQRLIPLSELERFVNEHLKPPTLTETPSQSSGRPPALAATVVKRIVRQFEDGCTFGEIARQLNAEGVPTAHGGRRWWPSTIRAILARQARTKPDEESETAAEPRPAAKDT